VPARADAGTFELLSMSIREGMRATCAVCIIWVKASLFGLALW
jgi:hypothetical protein